MRRAVRVAVSQPPRSLSTPATLDPPPIPTSNKIGKFLYWGFQDMQNPFPKFLNNFSEFI